MVVTTKGATRPLPFGGLENLEARKGDFQHSGYQKVLLISVCIIIIIVIIIIYFYKIMKSEQVAVRGPIGGMNKNHGNDLTKGKMLLSINDCVISTSPIKRNVWGYERRINLYALISLPFIA